MEKDEII